MTPSAFERLSQRLLREEGFIKVEVRGKIGDGGGSVWQVERIRQCHLGETNERLAERLWWTFLTVQFVEMTEVFVHQDRHHFWTSVVRLLITDTHRNKPSSRYADYLQERLNTLLSAPTAKWCSKVEL